MARQRPISLEYHPQPHITEKGALHGPSENGTAAFHDSKSCGNKVAVGIHTSQGAHAAHIARGRLVRAAARIVRLHKGLLGAVWCPARRRGRATLFRESGWGPVWHATPAFGAGGTTVISGASPVTNVHAIAGRVDRQTFGTIPPAQSDQHTALCLLLVAWAPGERGTSSRAKGQGQAPHYYFPCQPRGSAFTVAAMKLVCTRPSTCPISFKFCHLAEAPPCVLVYAGEWQPYTLPP